MADEKAKLKPVRVDNTMFNAEYWKDKTEQQFIDGEISAVSDSVGDKEKKIAWLREAWKKVSSGDTAKPTPDGSAPKPPEQK